MCILRQMSQLEKHLRQYLIDEITKQILKCPAVNQQVSGYHHSRYTEQINKLQMLFFYLN